MFQQFIEELAQVERLDRVTNTEHLTFGAVDGPSGKPRLALRLPSSEVLTLERHAQSQLVGQWGVPAGHIERLPIELAVKELTHFSTAAPREVTIRATREPGQDCLVARAVLSGRYEKFDSAEVLETVEPYLRGFHVSSAMVLRDEIRILVTMSDQEFDVSQRKVGDITRAGLIISNSEVGSLSLRAEFCMFRLICSNGMISPDQASTRIRHIHVRRDEFVARLRETVARAGHVGEQIARRLEATHALALPDLDPDHGRLQREVVSILRRANLWTESFAKEAELALREGEHSLFDLVQHVSDNARLAKERLADRVHRERVAGRLMALAA